MNTNGSFRLFHGMALESPTKPTGGIGASIQFGIHPINVGFFSCAAISPRRGSSGFSSQP